MDMPRRDRWIASAALLGLSACSNAGLDDDRESLEVAQQDQPLYYDTNYVWNKTNVNVCWQNYDPQNPDYDRVQAEVERAVNSLSALKFTGWGACTGPSDVVIKVANDEWPRGLGARAPSTMPNVYLNFFTGTQAPDLDGDGDPDFETCFAAGGYTGPTGRHWSDARVACIEVIAAHEFAHVAGFVHEQNRGDTPASCKEPKDKYGTTTFDYWDLTSITNYCNPAWSGDGYLSPLDVAGLHALYGPEGNDYLWLGFGNVRDYGNANADLTNFNISAVTISGDYTPLSGDFDGDGADDILWYRPGTGTDNMWWSDGDGTFTSQNLTVNGEYEPFIGDFNGDGSDDIFWYRPGTGTDNMWWSNGNRTFSSQNFSVNGTYGDVLTGDFDGNGSDDIFWYRPGTGTDNIWWFESDSSHSSENATVNGTYTAFVGDFNGDGADDIFWYRPGSGADTMWYANGDRTFSGYSSNVSGTYAPRAADFDGDGRDDILWSGSVDHVWLMNATPASKVTTRTRFDGAAMPIVGDFNGDGLGDILWYEPG